MPIFCFPVNAFSFSKASGLAAKASMKLNFLFAYDEDVVSTSNYSLHFATREIKFCFIKNYTKSVSGIHSPNK